ncbi:4-hydroxy-tetrahydrodipicolinate synthase [Halolamina pelagica]|uniref:4-hydroxy-tetrahydrodipicolinate synthase n=1 Tax=Halolamina pelagica TaxID=699431 RepID=A0A0P7HBT1_9EURY|nr:4-hydroxy-tetrahydrodipicolinate synthase [Halolamina pelagica]
MTTPFSGVFPAMTTPFREDRRIDHDQLAADAQRLEAAGVDGLVPVGSTGESATLTHDEHAQVVETVVDAVEDVPVIAGAGSNATHEAVSLAEDAETAGADAVLLISPYYNKPEAAGYLDHYRTIADAVDLPSIVYNVPRALAGTSPSTWSPNSPNTPPSRGTRPPAATSAASPR